MEFCGIRVRVEPGVYVPRLHSETLARRASDRLPEGGTAIDLCTGSGAIANVLNAARPGARVVASDLDERAVACARSNGVDAWHGDLFAPLPSDLNASVDVVVAVVPYVPTAELALLQRDTLAFESRRFYDGGAAGTDVLRRVIQEAPRFLRPGATLLLELGADQVEGMREELTAHRFDLLEVLRDEDGDVRGVEAQLRRPGPTP